MRETKTKDGKVLTRTSTGYWTELYTLDDGRYITAEELALRLETTSHTARARLNKSSDPNKIFVVLNKLTAAVMIGLIQTGWMVKPGIKIL